MRDTIVEDGDALPLLHGCGAGAPYPVVARAPFAAEAAAASTWQEPVPPMHLAHFCTFWAALDAEFAARQEALDLFEVRRPEKLGGAT